MNAFDLFKSYYYFTFTSSLITGLAFRYIVNTDRNRAQSLSVQKSCSRTHSAAGGAAWPEKFQGNFFEYASPGDFCTNNKP